MLFLKLSSETQTRQQCTSDLLDNQPEKISCCKVIIMFFLFGLSWANCRSRRNLSFWQYVILMEYPYHNRAELTSRILHDANRLIQKYFEESRVPVRSTPYSSPGSPWCLFLSIPYTLAWSTERRRGQRPSGRHTRWSPFDWSFHSHVTGDCPILMDYGSAIFGDVGLLSSINNDCGEVWPRSADLLKGKLTIRYTRFVC